MPFDTSVFINCPFDKAYKKLLRPLIFTCIYCGLEPKLSELKDSGSARVNGIIDLIKSCKFSIHDLSRMKSKEANELARFNMPFELGLELGVRESGEKELSSKLCLIIDSEKYRINIALSDLAGSDISSYGETRQVENIIRIIRDWLIAVIGPDNLHMHFFIQNSLNLFQIYKLILKIYTTGKMQSLNFLHQSI